MRQLANITRRVLGNSVQATCSYFERFGWSILNFWTLQFRCRHAPRSVVSKNSKLANENVQNNQNN